MTASVPSMPCVPAILTSAPLATPAVGQSRRGFDVGDLPES